ncbi:hypothetical protein RHGRI_019619 [Rhododendron griersonianum]|uniref:Rx N-terminal domain-containing protein n=1 Tax=Rhododendron griersonianum TaxID=479676 RepID=A0AAV6JG76_9ERIC|nr:hypothetical protein RHGRI_019619 [Rhododendron griersonianum]
MAGEALLGAAFGVLLDRLASKEFINFFRGRKHDEKLLIKKLKLKLLGLNKLLNDAEDKQFTDRAVKEWLDELKGAVYDAEDLVDEIATQALRCKVEAEYQSGSNQVQSLISSFTKLFDDEIESKLKGMIDVLEEFTEQKDVLGLGEVDGRNWSQTRLEDAKPCSTSENVRHFSYVRRYFDGVDKLKVIKDAKCLRTFLRIEHGYGIEVWLHKQELDEIISRMPRLRLLTLSRYCVKELPYSIGKLIHLRFLDLSYSHITQLPESVCTLYNLETLLLSNCRSLTTLPVDLEKLISLHRLDLSETSLKEMPVNISRLKDLQRLTAFVVGNYSGSGINGLKELNSLGGAITISGLENVTSGDDASEAKLKEKKQLESLTLEWGSTAEDSQKERDILENLEPPTNLKLLEIRNYGGTKFPTWLGDQPFGNMVSLTLEKCENCFSLPPLGQMPSLRTLTIKDCPKIESFPEGGLPSSLTDLSIKKCKKMKSLPEHMHTLLPSLESLYLFDCPEIESFPEGGLPSSLTRLDIGNCEKLKSLPEQMHTLLPSLESLQLLTCPEIESFPEGGLPSSLTCLDIKNCEKLKSLPEQMHTLLPSLESLQLLTCPEIESFPEGGLPSSLTRLDIKNCEKLKSLPEQMHTLLPSLESLQLLTCPEIESFPEGGLPSSLTRLDIGNCEKLKSLPEQMHTLLLSLESLRLYDCPEIESFPEGGLPSSLTHLEMNCEKLKSLPEQMHTLLPSLESLQLLTCSEIEFFPEGGLPSSLTDLYIWNCKKLVGGRRDWGLQALPSLTRLTMMGEFEDVLESFPEEGLLPPTLTDLSFGEMPDLKSLNGRGLQPLVSLKTMVFSKCPQLQSLSVERLPTSLSELHFWMCPLLVPRCRREEGEDWHKIAHIPNIYIDGRRSSKSIHDMWPGET